MYDNTNQSTCNSPLCSVALLLLLLQEIQCPLLLIIVNVVECKIKNDVLFCINKGKNNAWCCQMTTQHLQHNNENHKCYNVCLNLLVYLQRWQLISTIKIDYMKLLLNLFKLRCHHVQHHKETMMFIMLHYHHIGLWLWLFLQTKVRNAINRVESLYCNYQHCYLCWH